MILMTYSKVLVSVLFCIFCVTKAKSFYEEQDTEVSEQAVLNRWKGLSPTTCLLRCRRNKDCQVAALTEFECLCLKNETNAKDGDENSVGIQVKLLRDINTQKKPQVNEVVKSSGKIHFHAPSR